MNYITYELWNPLNNQIFYVGAGDPDRPQDHLNDYYKIKSNGWKKKYNRSKYEVIKEIISDNKNVDIRIILETDNRASAFELEIILIKQYGRKDLGLGPLTNMTNGGDGGDWTKGKDPKEVKLVYKKRGNQSDSFKAAQRWYNQLSKKEQKEWHRKQAEKRTFDWYISRVDDGKETLIHNLQKWCKRNNIDPGAASNISNPNHRRYGKSASGWRIRRSDHSSLPPYENRQHAPHPNRGWSKGKSWKLVNGKRVYSG